MCSYSKDMSMHRSKEHPNFSSFMQNVVLFFASGSAWNLKPVKQTVLAAQLLIVTAMWYVCQLLGLGAPMCSAAPSSPALQPPRMGRIFGFTDC